MKKRDNSLEPEQLGNAFPPFIMLTKKGIDSFRRLNYNHFCTQTFLLKDKLARYRFQAETG